MKDKTVLITGAGSGIGRATALLYARHGANVVVADIHAAAGQEAVRAVEAAGGKGLFVETNVAEYGAVEALVARTVSHFGRLDIAVNNAGIGTRDMVRTELHSADDWERVIAVNQTGVFYCMKFELQQMMAQGGGSIVNVASVAGLRALSNTLAYVASKHAVVGMTKAAAQEYARKNIRINAVCPVFTHSALFQQLLDSKDGIEDKLRSGIPMGRFGEPEEIAEAIFWLGSEAAGFITGHALPIDGGLMA